uniref:3-demethylubiquinone-9 3-methyltransferase n=1 Tax=Lygus hesperus TaxID=30085 RepID=A0A0A9XII4_LYGHE
MNLFRLRVFLPRTLYTVEDIEDVRHAAETYQKLLQTSVSEVLAEFKLWVAKWNRIVENGGELPDSLSLVCAECDEEMYPSIWKLLIFYIRFLWPQPLQKGVFQLSVASKLG